MTYRRHSELLMWGRKPWNPAIADTHPKDGDAQQAPLVSGGGSEGNRP